VTLVHPAVRQAQFKVARPSSDDLPRITPNLDPSKTQTVGDILVTTGGSQSHAKLGCDILAAIADPCVSTAAWTE